ncbi:glycosyltransferase family 4 protein [Crenobacter caeni]|uniref:Glycosyltransferase family 4 protein n=1 Tax=Crenobacter caeni TaxID=2705474 RepID=A0A6B2KTA0_9NEIS|nr:glycosyltransferase family 4 protein [Crenobacter caeni]NDV13475.1 glycosyltransferase family 4 protein [Crenobacter caeni]
MTRLAIVRQKYNPAGGAERFVSRALDALAREGSLEVSLIARHWEQITGVHALKADPWYLGSLWRDAGFARAARTLWQREGFELVQSHERIPGCQIFRAGDGVHARWLDLRRRTMGWAGRLRLAINPYHHYVRNAERRMFLDPALRLVICNSRMVMHEIQQDFGLSDDKVAVIYNGVDTEAFHPRLRVLHREPMRERWQVPADAPVLLYVGSGFERKGVERALRAVVGQERVHLVVVGGDKHLNRYQTLASRLGIEARVRFTGPQHDVKPFYGMADAFILPTLYDPFPNVCVEALACGLPLLTTRQCGAAEFVREGENGWVVDALDQPALQQAVSSWLALRGQWSALSAAAREAAEPLTLDAMAETLLACYRRLLAAA